MAQGVGIRAYGDEGLGWRRSERALGFKDLGFRDQAEFQGGLFHEGFTLK